MRSIFLAFPLAILFATAASAQQAAPPTVDELSARLSFTEQQRNQHASEVAYLQGQLTIAGRQINQANAKVAELQKKLDELQKQGDGAKSPAPPTTEAPPAH